ncbi:hypothetical protein HNQ91_002037 [Filimonas zeae]|uniref:Uncharacterized protein n=1 Tax=Filimonas zeae TaxID=1737353 RepID=A0A917IWC9_9BACT|nr:hypothetical protein [Filimonas zeae]MDR6338986.1 hypothetical protein [Filimonas zeae]GGH65652.1 hypothetical protein GCM10011379_19010 [Filimonas zeae]
MNKSKIILSAATTIAAIGGALALKTSKFDGTAILLDENRDGICTTEAMGFKSTTFQSGYLYNYITATAAESKLCSSSYYLAHP